MITAIRYIAAVCVSSAILSSCSSSSVSDARLSDRQAPIFPDYADVTIPPNIAPLNFCPDTTGITAIDAVICGADGTEIHCTGKNCVDIPLDDWKSLLQHNRGGDLSVTVSLRGDEGWTTYPAFAIHVSDDEIDYGLAYRLIAPGYEKYGKMGIYERSLSDFDERPVIENTNVSGCVNCHTFNRCDPASMSLHVRGEHGATLLRSPQCPLAAYDTRTTQTISALVYPYWHPDGRYIAYSTNATHQVIHTDSEQVVEVFDDASDIQIFDTATGTLLLPDALRRDTVWETFPAFSPDGTKLYFCAAEALELPDSMRCVRYDLCRVDFDAATGAVGDKIDTLVHASAAGKSATLPRPSFDGRHLVYTLADYGTFPVWHSEADLYILDTTTGESRPLTLANSDRTESSHNFSSTSRWLVFASRRIDGLYSRPYIVHIDAKGRESKPFLLPQRDPRAFYDARFQSFNLPEFITAPVDLPLDEATSLLLSRQRKNVN